MGATVLGFDVGARRIGVAVGNTVSASARAVAVVEMRRDPAGREQADWSAIARLLGQWRPALLLVGDPRTLDGGDQPARRRALRFAHAAAERFGLPVSLVDERSSSVEAAQRFAAGRAAGVHRRSGAERLDALAAAIILERWLSDPSSATPLSAVPQATAAETDPDSDPP